MKSVFLKFDSDGSDRFSGRQAGKEYLVQPEESMFKVRSSKLISI